MFLFTGWYQTHSFVNSYPACTFLFKVKNTNTRTSCEICSKLTIKTPERRLCQCFFFNKVVALRVCLRNYHNLTANNRTRTFFKCLTWYEIVPGTAKYMDDVFVSNGNSFYQHCALHKKCPDTEFFLSVFSCIQSEYRKIRTKKNSVFGHFSHSV